MADQNTHVHGLLAGAAVVIALGGFTTYRALGPGAGNVRQVLTAPPPAPSVDLQPWLPYAAPSPDSGTMASVATVAGHAVPGHAVVVSARDPFAPPIVAAVASVRSHAEETPAAAADPDSAWVVTATLIAGARRAAVINDKLVYVGDSLPGGGRLTAVEHDRVVVTDPRGAAHALPVKEGDE